MFCRGTFSFGCCVVAQLSHAFCEVQVTCSVSGLCVSSTALALTVVTSPVITLINGTYLSSLVQVKQVHLEPVCSNSHCFAMHLSKPTYISALLKIDHHCTQCCTHKYKMFLHSKNLTLVPKHSSVQSLL